MPILSPLPWTYVASAGIPDGNLVGFHWRLPLESRPSIQQSSRFTYWYPAACIPLLTNASATAFINVSFMLHSKVFHEFQPMGGVAANTAAAPPEPAAASDPATPLELAAPPEPVAPLDPVTPPEPLPPAPVEPPVPFAPPGATAPPVPTAPPLAPPAPIAPDSPPVLVASPAPPPPAAVASS